MEAGVGFAPTKPYGVYVMSVDGLTASSPAVVPVVRIELTGRQSYICFTGRPRAVRDYTGSDFFTHDPGEQDNHRKHGIIDDENDQTIENKSGQYESQNIESDNRCSFHSE